MKAEIIRVNGVRPVPTIANAVREHGDQWNTVPWRGLIKAGEIALANQYAALADNPLRDHNRDYFRTVMCTRYGRHWQITESA